MQRGSKFLGCDKRILIRKNKSQQMFDRIEKISA